MNLNNVFYTNFLPFSAYPKKIIKLRVKKLIEVLYKVSKLI